MLLGHVECGIWKKLIENGLWVTNKIEQKFHNSFTLMHYLQGKCKLEAAVFRVKGLIRKHLIS